MDTLLRPVSPSERAQARTRARGPRRFHRAAPEAIGGEPPRDAEDDGPIWPAPRRPSGDGYVTWPFWLILLVPWAMWGFGMVLQALKICLICIPDSVTLQP
jgi:hypothetical protein